MEFFRKYSRAIVIFMIIVFLGGILVSAGAFFRF
jgi:hypothetical protein